MNPRPLKLALLASVLITGLTAPALYGQIVPGDTFDVSVAGFDLVSSLWVVSPIDATFGTTTVYHGAGLGGADVTVSSSQTIVGTTMTDTVTLSVPVNFLPPGTTAEDGGVVTEMEFDVGGYYAGTDRLTLSQALNPATLKTTGSEQYEGGTFALQPLGVTLNANTQLAGYETVSSGPTDSDLSRFAINSFTMSFSYMNPAPVPEPASLVLAGLGGLALLAFRNRR